MAGQTVHIVFIGMHRIHLNRHRYLLRKYIPHKVYFIRYSESQMIDSESKVKSYEDELIDELKKELPKWVQDSAIDISLPVFNFEEVFPKFLKILMDEKKEGNRVVVNLHGTSDIMVIAAAIAATLTGAEVYTIKAKNYKRISAFDNIGKDERMYMVPEGVKGENLLRLPIFPELPKKPLSDVLLFLLENNGLVQSKLIKIAKAIGLEKLGRNVEKPGSGAVKLSKILKTLREDKLVETQRVGRKDFEIKLTKRGKLMAEILAIIH